MKKTIFLCILFGLFQFFTTGFTFGADEVSTEAVSTEELPTDFSQDHLEIPRTSLDIGDQFNTPDGMTVDGQGNIILAVPNAYAREGGTWLLKITPDDKIEKYFWLTPHPETNKACPMGMTFAPDGHLYICDDQGACGNVKHKSRILRVVHHNGKPVREEVLVTNLIQPNRIIFANHNIYFTEAQLSEDSKESPIESGVFCFAIKEFQHLHNPIRVTAHGNDRHCIYRLKTYNPEWKVGAFGIGMAKDGKLYVANCGDKQVIELSLDKPGYKVLTHKICIEGGPIESINGLMVCPKGYIMLADFIGNAVHIANPENGRTFTLAKDALGAGETDGELDRCSEVRLRGNKLYVSNFDIPYKNKNDLPNTLSILKLEGIDFDVLLK